MIGVFTIFSFFFQIRGHINFFPAQESHCSRKNNSGKQFLKEDLSVQRMNNLYLEENEPEVCYKQQIISE